MNVNVTFEKGEVFVEGLGPLTILGMCGDVLLGTKYEHYGEIRQITIGDLNTPEADPA